jgi:hypothetical protein
MLREQPFFRTESAGRAVVRRCTGGVRDGTLGVRQHPTDIALEGRQFVRLFYQLFRLVLRHGCHPCQC